MLPNKHRIVISEFIDDEAATLLNQAYAVTLDPGLVDDRPRLLARLADADALIVRNRTLVDAGLLAAAPRLKVVGRLGVGLDNIDLPACQARDIAVFPATGANAQAVAEYVIAATLILLRGGYGETKAVSAGLWPRTALGKGREAAGKTLGIVGFGGIGQLTARLARGLGLSVVAYDPLQDAGAPAYRALSVAPVGLDELLAMSDVISLHLPLNADTRSLFDAARLERIKPGAILINTARGGIVDEAALARLLRDGRLAGAALDVFADEPLPPGSPLADVPNLLLTPHIAGLTVESNSRVSLMVARRVDDALRALGAPRGS